MKKKTKPFTPAQRKKVLQAYKTAGMATLAKRFGCSIMKISRVIHAGKVTVRAAGRPKKK